MLAAGHADQWPGETPTIPFRIRPHELLKIQAVCVLLDAPINGEYRVHADGKVDLGEPYGSVVVKGLGLEEAERAIKKRLREMLARPEVSVTLTGWKRGPKDSAATVTRWASRWFLARRTLHAPREGRRPCLPVAEQNLVAADGADPRFSSRGARGVRGRRPRRAGSPAECGSVWPHMAASLRGAAKQEPIPRLSGSQ